MPLKFQFQYRCKAKWFYLSYHLYGKPDFLLFVDISLFFRIKNPTQLKTIVIVGILLSISIGIVTAVFVFGGMYQQELFEEYMEDVQTKPGSEVNPNLPYYDIAP